MRIYINDFSAKHPWSVDEGNIATEKNFDEVVILRDCYTVVELSKRGSKAEPCCWIECFGELIDLGNGKAQIV